MKLNWNSRRVGRGVRKNSLHGGGMDIFWNYTMGGTGLLLAVGQ